MKYTLLLLLLFLALPSRAQTVSSDHVRADLDSLIRVMTEVHPTFNDSPNKERLLTLSDTIDRSMTVHDFFRLVQPLIAIDGHTTFQFTGEILPAIEEPAIQGI